MRKFLLLGTIFVTTGALAFGGIGIGSWQRHKSNSGVDAIGVHIEPKGKKANIKIVDGDSCASGVTKDRFGHCNICENGNVYLSYMDDPCGTATEVTGCVSNTQCGENEYCNLTGDNCEQPNTGVCTALNEDDIKTTFENGYIISQNSFSYWAAENWCAAWGKQMIGLADIGIDPSSVSGVINNGETCQEGNGCHLDYWQSVLDQVSYNWFWVNDGIDTCKGVYVRTFDKYIGPREGRQGGTPPYDAPALCK